MAPQIRFSFLILSLALASCSKKDQPSPDQVRIASVEERIVLANGVPRTSIYSFSYDHQGRISSVNDRNFYYSTNNKVAYSRVYSSKDIGLGMKEEYIEKLRYSWDNQGRIISIVADSIYRHQYSKTEPQHTTLKNLSQGVLIAEYQYAGNSKRPASIRYLTNFDLPGNAKQGSISVEYQGNNVARERSLTSVDMGLGNVPGTPQTLLLYAHYQYSNHPNYLYKAYQQLGFHPYNFGLVVSENNATNIYYEIYQQLDAPASENPDWNKSEKLVTEFNSFGYPVGIKFTSPAIVSVNKTITISYH